MYYIGIDLGGTNIAVGIVDENGKILAKKSVPTGAERGEDAVIADMAKTSVDICSENGYSMDDIASIGIGSPGLVDKAAGVVVSASNLGFKRTELVEKFKKHIDKTVYLENDANCAAWAEAEAGAAKGTKHSVMVTLGTGVGGGMVIDGKLYSGFNFYGGEFGHVIIEASGKDCVCGRKGCWEAYSSATALSNLTKEYAEKNKDSLLWECAEKRGKFSGRTAFEAARMGDRTAQLVKEEYLKYLAVGIENLILTFQPEVVVVGGGVSNEGADLFEPLTEMVMKTAYGSKVPEDKRTRIEKALLGNDAGIVGAALLKE